MVEMLGPEAATRVTKRRGRWRSDIFFIYVRTDASEQLAASATMADASGHEIESIVPTFVQPTRGWGR